MSKRDTLDQVVRYFVQDNGGFLVVSHDNGFIKMFKGCLKSLGISSDSLHTHYEIESYVKQTSSLLKRYKRLILFVEASIEGRSSTVFFKQVKEFVGDRAIIICISTEVDRELLFLFHEMGADNIIIKPVSVNSIVEKIAFTLKPNNLRQMVDKAKEAIAAGEYSPARIVVNEIFKISPESAIGNILLGDIHKCEKDYREAEARYKKATQNARMYLEPLERLVQLYEETGQKERKLEVLKKLDKISPLNHERKLSIGDAYADLGDVDNTKAYYDDALRLVRKNANDLMSNTMMQVGKRMRGIDSSLSLEYMDKALELKKGSLSKEDLWMFNEIGLALRKQGKWEEAVKNYNSALQVSRNDGGILYNMAMAYMQGRQYYKAVQQIEKALESSPELLNYDANIPYNIALVYHGGKQYPEAQQYAKIALVNDPDHSRAAELLQQLQSG
ncbi:MAG: tetratricopeptide repeat protein [Desulfonatronovibrionaceae bacterium]